MDSIKIAHNIVAPAAARISVGLPLLENMPSCEILLIVSKPSNIEMSSYEVTTYAFYYLIFNRDQYTLLTSNKV